MSNSSISNSRSPTYKRNNFLFTVLPFKKDSRGRVVNLIRKDFIDCFISERFGLDDFKEFIVAKAPSYCLFDHRSAYKFVIYFIFLL